MALLNRMTEMDYREVTNAKGIVYLAYGRLPDPLDELSIFSFRKRNHALATNGVLFFPKEETDDVVAENREWYFLEENSERIAKQLGRELKRALPSYGFEIVGSFDDYSMQEGESEWYDQLGLDMEKFMGLRVFDEEGRHFGNIDMIGYVLVDLGGSSGFDRRLDRGEKAVIESLREDVKVAAVSLNNAVEILWSSIRVFPRSEIPDIEIKPRVREIGEAQQLGGRTRYVIEKLI